MLSFRSKVRESARNNPEGVKHRLSPTEWGVGQLIVLVLLAVSGCGSSECSGDAHASVIVRVVNAGGTTVEDAEVTYSVDGGQDQPAECWDKTDNGCASWSAGIERVGRFLIRATSGDGTKSTTRSVDVGAREGQCGVATQDVTLTIQ